MIVIQVITSRTAPFYCILLKVHFILILYYCNYVKWTVYSAFTNEWCSFKS